MEEEILAVMAKIEAAGGMYKAVGSGLVQTMIGQSALAAQQRIERGEEKIIGSTASRRTTTASSSHRRIAPIPRRCGPTSRRSGRSRSSEATPRSGASSRRSVRAAQSSDENVFARVVEAAYVGVTHGEIVEALRDELGFGHPLVVV